MSPWLAIVLAFVAAMALYWLLGMLAGFFFLALKLVIVVGLGFVVYWALRRA